MIVYIWHDESPAYGHLSVDQNKPDFDRLPKQITEVRLAEIPDWLMDTAINGGLPLDDAEDTEHHGNDEVWQPYWDEAQLVWKR